MRIHLLGLILLASVSAPALAQSRPDTVERRVGRLEQELRAVQRRVFPNGTTQFVEPEIGAATPGRPGNAASGDALSGLNARVDSLETQLRALTGQVEQQGYRMGQIEEQVTRLRADLGAAQASRPTNPPAVSRPAPEVEAPAFQEPRTPAAAPATDGAEEAYNAGFRLWDQRRFAEDPPGAVLPGPCHGEQRGDVQAGRRRHQVQRSVHRQRHHHHRLRGRP